MQHGKPSLVRDLMDIYRYLIDNFLIGYCRKLKPRDFIVKTNKLAETKKENENIYLIHYLET